jgi:hypothetical protein
LIRAEDFVAGHLGRWRVVGCRDEMMCGMSVSRQTLFTYSGLAGDGRRQVLLGRKKVSARE